MTEFTHPSAKNQSTTDLQVSHSIWLPYLVLSTVIRDPQDLQVHYKYILVVVQVINCKAMYYPCWFAWLGQVSKPFSSDFFSCQFKELSACLISQETLWSCLGRLVSVWGDLVAGEVNDLTVLIIPEAQEGRLRNRKWIIPVISTVLIVRSVTYAGCL